MNTLDMQGYERAGVSPPGPRQGVQAHLADPALIRHGCFIGGEWQAASDRALLPVRNPASGEWLGSVACAGATEAQMAIESAVRALPAWRGLTPDARGAVLRGWATLIRLAREDLATIMTLEQGKPLAEARGEVDYAASFLDWFAEEGRRAYGETIPSHLTGSCLLTFRQSIGVAAAITPWNFPVAMITRKAGAALAAGCPMIVRPADETPFCALALAVLAQRAGVPNGVFSVVTGDPQVIAGTFMSSQSVRALSFTGSTEVGRALLKGCADSVKRVSLELGGHAPFIVFEDAAVERAVELAIDAKFQTSGQDCLAANRILVHQRSYAEFVERFAARAAQLRVGNGMEPEVAIGPLISATAAARCEAQIQDAMARGARLCTGGGRHAAGPSFITPTVLADVVPGMRIWSEETFGPVAAITPFSDESAALELANDSEYGLAAYVCTENLGRALRMGAALEAGMIAVNTARFTGPPIPFGGMKQSGLGREGSRHGLDEYMELKYVCLATGAA